ncbi:MAG: hypothetical protein SFV23_25630 [Planctomycetaceae bacterium]|nr:hypothetical protein [Planctomycetaceae bacterium]
MSGAQVETTAALSDVRSALIVFAERAQAALASLRQETRSTLRWLHDEQPHYWQQELRRAYDRVASTRIEYETCRMRTVAGHRSACIEEKVAFQKAQRRLEYVQQQIEVTRRWGIQAADQANEFFGKIGPLERILDYDLPQMVAVLERMLTAIEAYASDVAEPESVSVSAVAAQFPAAAVTPSVDEPSQEEPLP